LQNNDKAYKIKKTMSSTKVNYEILLQTDFLTEVSYKILLEIDFHIVVID